MLQGKVYYEGKHYRVQEVKGWKHIVVKKKRIGLSRLQPVRDSAFNYIFEGAFLEHPCHAVNYWIVRWRMKVKISYGEYKEKYIK